MKGIGTKDEDLMRILISRAEVDLPQIKVQYRAMFGTSLYDAVKSDLSGDYKVFKFLLFLLSNIHFLLIYFII